MQNVRDVLAESVNMPFEMEFFIVALSAIELQFYQFVSGIDKRRFQS
jgi:hypothetical protein